MGPAPTLEMPPLLKRKSSWVLAPLLLPLTALAAQEEQEAAAIEEIVVTARAELLGFREAHANNTVGRDALQAENPAVDVLSRINRLPGVNVTQGDAVGGNDWSTRIYIRGMSDGTDTAQIGYMVDGMPNGDSVYGGGQKPSVFVDNENVAAVQVGQNTADIGSASNSALGGTIRYTTAEPLDRRGVQLAYTGGEHGLRRWFARLDSGEPMAGLTSYLSVSDSSLNSWIGTGSGRFDRQHMDLNVVKQFAQGTAVKLKAGWNYRNETDYNSITLADFRANPKSDHLLDDFDIDTVALWRPGWGGTRWDKSAALEIHHDGLATATTITVTPYIHQQKGWGWWVPPFRVAILDGRIEGPQGAPEYYRDTFQRNAGGGLVPAPGTSVADHPCLRGRYPADTVSYALAPNFDCAAAERVASRRRSGYRNHRSGVTSEAQRAFGRHTLTAGLWLEQQNRDNDRHWFDLDRRDPGTIRPAASALHWTHFDRRFETTSQRYYLQDRIGFGPLELTAALVYHAVETEYASRLDSVERRQSRTEWLPKLGAIYAWQPNVELFASYSRNVLMLADDLLAAGTTGHLRPELSDNFDAGVRWNGTRGGIAMQAFAQRFDGRLGAVNLAAVGGDLYLQGAIEILNVGGVDSSGFELAASFDLGETLTAYSAYSYLDTEYTDAVPAEGIVAGNRLVNAARSQWFGELTWRPTTAWRLALNAKHVGKRPADLANAETVPAYTLIGLNAEYTLPRWRAMGAMENASVQFNASNLANERYLSAPDGDQGGTFFLGPARMASVTLRVDL